MLKGRFPTIRFINLELSWVNIFLGIITLHNNNNGLINLHTKNELS